jgi:transposase-like protein
MPNKHGEWKGFVNIRVVLQLTYQQGRSKFKLFLFHSIAMAHHGRSIRERVIALAEEIGLTASTSGEMWGVPKSTARAWLQKYRRDGQVGKRGGTGLWRVSSPAQNAALVAEAQRNPFWVQGILKLLLAFLGQKKHIYFETKEGRPQGTARCGEGVPHWGEQTIPFNICWEQCRSHMVQLYSPMNLHLAQQMMGRF